MFKDVANSVLDALQEHDEQDSSFKHQAILMVNKKQADLVLKTLNSNMIVAESIYPPFDKSKRGETLQRFKDNKFQVLVTSKLPNHLTQSTISVVGVTENFPKHFLQKLIACAAVKTRSDEPIESKVIFHEKCDNMAYIDIYSSIDKKYLNKEVKEAMNIPRQESNVSPLTMLLNQLSDSIELVNKFTDMKREHQNAIDKFERKLRDEMSKIEKIQAKLQAHQTE